jgi:hypothetical protein
MKNMIVKINSPDETNEELESYELLRDTPSNKAGAIFTKSKRGRTYKSEVSQIVILAIDVENNSEWFKKVNKDKVISPAIKALNKVIADLTETVETLSIKLEQLTQ